MLTMTDTRSGDLSVSVTEAGPELALATWLGPARPDESAVEQGYRTLAGSLRERGMTPLQERVFADLRVAGAVARGRAAGLRHAGVAWGVGPTFVEGAPVGREGIAG